MLESGLGLALEQEPVLALGLELEPALGQVLALGLALELELEPALGLDSQ